MIKTALREDMALLYQADPELEVIQVNFTVRRIHEQPKNFAMLNYNYTK
jgi:hypothetical protein